MEYLEILWALLLVLAVCSSWSLNLFGLPGNWLIVFSTVIYIALASVGGRLAIGWWLVALLLLLAALGEVIEFAAGAMGVARLGGSRRGAVFALIGSLAGGLIGAFVGLPIPVVGSVLAALLFGSLGALAGAVWGETHTGRDWDSTWQIGKAAFWGRLFGTLGKIVTGSLMIVVVVVALFF